MAPLASASANDEQVLQRIFGVGDGAFEDLAPESESGSLRTDLNVPDEELRRSLREGEARAVALAANVDGHEEALRLLNALLRSCRSHASLYANRAQLLLLMEPSLVQKVALDDADVIAFTGTLESRYSYSSLHFTKYCQTKTETNAHFQKNPCVNWRALIWIAQLNMAQVFQKSSVSISLF